MDITTFRSRTGSFVVCVESDAFGMYSRWDGCEHDAIRSAIRVFALTADLDNHSSAFTARSAVVVDGVRAASWRKS